MDGKTLMENFNPLKSFCQMHEDKLIAGSNSFGPACLGISCEAFLWAKLNVLVYKKPLMPELSIVEPPEKIPPPQPDYLELERAWGQACEDWYLYVLW